MTDRRPSCRFVSRNVLLLVIFFFAITVSAQTTAFNYQGHLKSGANPANGNYEMEFKLYDSLSGGAQVGKTVTDTNVAVINGSFVATLDFGSAPFDPGPARFLEIGVRSAGNPDPFTVLTPRQTINSTPYVIQARNALTADNATNALQLGGVDASEYVTVTSAGNSFIKNDTKQQTADFNISGNGKVGGSIGIGVDPFPGVKLDVNGDTVIRTSGSGGNIQFGTPNTETGMTILGASGRADIRFNGTTLRLLNGPAGGPPAVTNGITVSTLGNVGIGMTTPNASDAKLKITGNVSQDRPSNGLVKAMIHVQSFGSILGCYNGVTNSSTGNCGFSITRDPNDYYTIDFGFQVNDRFVSVSAEKIIGGRLWTSFSFASSSVVRVYIYDPDEIFGVANPFMIIIF